jgi:hypothetical protein
VKVERLFLFALAAAVVLLLLRWQQAPIEHPPGVLAPHDPVQESVSENAFVHGDYTLRQRARFDIRARVLSRRNYRFDRGADLSPLDLALGWGPMSDQAVLDQIDVHQGARWYRLRWDHPGPLTEREVMRHSGNMHVVPAGETITDALDRVQEGQVLRLQGYLVDASSADGFIWTTSLSRDDTGDGSCELFYVEHVFLEGG